MLVSRGGGTPSTHNFRRFSTSGEERALGGHACTHIVVGHCARGEGEEVTSAGKGSMRTRGEVQPEQSPHGNPSTSWLSAQELSIRTHLG